LGEVNKKMNGIQLRDSSVCEVEKVDVSMEMRPEDPDATYNWNGASESGKAKHDWSYRDYMKEQEEEEERREKEKKIEVITIEDDN